MIYAIRCGSDGPIKLGRATNPISRMAELQTAHHRPLNLLAAVKWEDNVEPWLHKFLEDDRLNGEWFNPTEQVLWVVERMRDKEALEELVNRFDHMAFFPWMSEEEPGLIEYRRDLASRCGQPPFVSSSGRYVTS